MSVKEAEHRHIEYLEREISETQAYLDRLKHELAIARGGRYAGVKIKTAIYGYLDERGNAVDRRDVEQALIRDGAVSGKRQGASQIGKSIDRLLRAGRLRCVGSLIGKAEWPGERFSLPRDVTL